MSTKQTATNSFAKGLITDTQPLVTPNDVMTDCINGTIITRRGNEYTLQNDLGNEDTKAHLKPGFVPVGSTVHDGIWYVLSTNGDEVEIGSFPSPAINNREINTEVKKEFVLLDIEDRTSYDYSYLESHLQSSNHIIELGDYYYLSENSLPEFIYASYTDDDGNEFIPDLYPTINNGVIDYNSLNWIENKYETINIWCQPHIVNISTEIDSNLWKESDGRIYGTIDISCIPNRKLHNSTISIDVNINGNIRTFDTAGARIDISEDSDFVVKVNPKLHCNVNNSEITINYDEVIETIFAERLHENKISIFQYYYYDIDINGITVYFDCNRYGEPLPKELSCFIESVDGNILLNGVSKFKNLWTVRFEYTDNFRYNEIYKFGVIVGENSFKKLLITSEAFNSFKNYKADYSLITPDEWVPNIKLNDINVTVTLGESKSEYITNDTSLPYRKYQPKAVDELKHNEFLANWIPYISTSVTDDSYMPALGIRNGKEVLISDEYKIPGDGMLSKLYGDHQIEFNGGKYIQKDSPIIIGKTSGYIYHLNKTAIEKTFYERKYLHEFTEPIIIKLSKDSEEYGIQYGKDAIFHYLQINGNGKTFNQILSYILTDVNSSNVSKQSISSGSLLHDSYQQDPYELGRTWESKLGEPSWTVDSDYLSQLFFWETQSTLSNTLLYEWFLKQDAVFIPIGFELDENSNLNITTDKIVYCVLAITKRANKFEGVLVQINNENFIDKNKAVNTANIYNNRIYSIGSEKILSVYKLTPDNLIKFEENSANIETAISRYKITGFNINGVSSEKFVNNLDVDTTNIRFEDPISITQKLILSDVVSYNADVSEEILNNIKFELETIPVIHNDVVYTTGSKNDLNELLYNTEYKIVSTDKIKSIFGTEGDSNTLSIDDSQHYINKIPYKQTLMCSNERTEVGSPESNFTLTGISEFNIPYSDELISLKSQYQIAGSLDEYLKRLNYED